MSEPASASREVGLPEGASASTFFHRLLSDAIREFGDVFDGLAPPASAKAFKKTLGVFLIAFEQRRCASPRSGEVAKFIVERARSGMRFGTRPLNELSPAPGLDVEDGARGSDSPEWVPRIDHDGESFSGARLRELVDRLAARGHVGTGAAAVLSSAVERLGLGGGRLDLTGERFALLGAGAEIAPTVALLEAGATVLWCDVQAPPEALRRTPGRLLHAPGRVDLLSAPDQIAAAVIDFTQAEGPAHLGMFAYAPGKGREWRLGAAMNAVARAIPEAHLRSVGLYVSPTSPAAPEPADVDRAMARWASRPVWQRALTAVGALRRNRSRSDYPWVADTVVPVQGVSYQAAQYIEKTLATEALALERPSLRISTSVAPVTRTRSLEHPLFAAAFRGTDLFGVEAFAPQVTRTLCALMYLENVLGDAPSAPQYVHGGLFSQPFALDGAIRIAALKGSVSRG